MEMNHSLIELRKFVAKREDLLKQLKEIEVEINDAFENLPKSLLDLYALGLIKFTFPLTPYTKRMFGPEKQAACIHAYKKVRKKDGEIPGEDGYELAESVQPDNPELRFIP